MRILWIGYGQAGGKTVNALMEEDRIAYRALAVNTEKADLAGLNRVTAQLVIGKYKLKGRGVGGDLALGAEIAYKSLSQMMDQINQLRKGLDPEALWIVSGLAGGTGAGGAPILAAEIKSTWDLPVYGLGILPATFGMPPEKEIMHLTNALKSIEAWQQVFDNILLMDNEQYISRDETRESIEDMYDRLNTEIAKRLTILLTAGEAKHAPQEVLAAPEIKATMGNHGGFSAIGYRGEDISLKSRFWHKGIDPDDRRLEEIIKESIATASLTFPCDISGSTAAALVVHGRPQHLFTQAIQAGKAYIEKAMGVAAIRYGDYPDAGCQEISAITLISGISDLSRLNEMRKRVEEFG